MPSNDTSENELIQQAAQGDRDAFDALTERCAGQIYSLAFRLTGKQADAEDLAQDAFVNAFRNLARFEQRSSFSSWVYRITVNLWKNKVKYEKRRFFFSHFSLDRVFGTEDDETRIELPSDEPDPLGAAEKQDESRRVQDVLARLDADERTLIVLCDIEERTYEEIAQLLNCPLGTVKSKVSRARESLRKEWSRCHAMPGM